MIEALVQAAAWLVRIQQDFSRSVVVLRAAKNVRYARFVAPGETLRCEVDAIEIGDESAKFKAAGFVGETQCVSARLELACINLADRDARLASADKDIRAQLRRQFCLVGGPAALAAVTA